MSNKIKILGIAPYASMKALMSGVAARFPQIDLTVYVGDLDEGVEIVKNITEIYDVIISRGGTAQRIQEISSVPVMDISLSVYDILRAVKLADNYGQKYAIVGFPRITDSASTLCDLLQHHATILTIHSSEEAMTVSQQLKADGYQLLLGDNIATFCAKKLGIHSILITSGAESITATFQQAITFFRNIADIRTELAVIRSSFRGQASSTLILNEQGDSVFSCFNTEDLDITASIVSRLKNMRNECLEIEKKKFFITIDQKMFSIASYSYDDNGIRYVAFHIWSNDVPVVSTRKGLKISNSPQPLENNSLFESITSNQELISQIKKMEPYTTPVILLGEKGVGKSHLAALIHTYSPLKNNPFIEIDCRFLSARNWNYLISSYNSPFLDSNNTLYFREVNHLDKEQMERLTSLILDSNLCGRNRVIFSYSMEYAQPMISPEFYDFINSFTPVTFPVLPLREHIRELPKIANLYLNDLNIELGKGLVGFEPEALDLLQNYSWPCNITQFKRILREAAIISDSSYVTSGVIDFFLTREPAPPSASQHTSNTNAKPDTKSRRTLAQIEKETVLAALEENNGNQTKTARELGISRSTLWRYLKM